MKKIFAVLVLFSMIFSLTGCGSDEKKTEVKKVETQKMEKTPEQIQAEKDESERQEKIKAEKIAAEKIEREKNFLANNYNEIYKWCYWMFYKIGYSDDVLQYSISNGDAESMRDLNFVMNKFQSDLSNAKYSVNANIPDNLRNLMYDTKNKLEKSFQLRKNGNYDEIQQSYDIENEVVQQLIQIQQMLPEGIKYWSYQGIYDSNDEIDIPSEYKDDSKVTVTIGNGNENDDDRVYGQTGPNLIGE